MHLQRLDVDYFASCRLVVDYFAYATRPGASACRVARRRLLRLHRASGCLGTSHGSSSTSSPHKGSSLTTSPTPRVWVPRHVARLVDDYFSYVTRSGALARRVARCRLLRLHRASGCLGTSRGSSCGSSSTTSPRVARRRLLRPMQARHRLLRARRFASRRLVVDYFASRRLVIDYFTHPARPSASARRAARCRPRAVLPIDFLSVSHTGSRRAPNRSVSRFDYSVHYHWTCCLVALALLQPRRASRLLVSRQHRLYFEYVAHRRGIVFRPHRVDHSSLLSFLN
jgi:hypothetical protein